MSNWKRIFIDIINILSCLFPLFFMMNFWRPLITHIISMKYYTNYYEHSFSIGLQKLNDIKELIKVFIPPIFHESKSHKRNYFIFSAKLILQASTQSSLKTLIASNIYCSIWSIHSIYAISIVVHRNFATTTHWFDLKRQMSHAASFSLFNGWILWNTCRFIRDSCYLLFNYRLL